MVWDANGWSSIEELAAAGGGEGVLDVFDLWLAGGFGPEEGDHVEAGWVVEQAVGFQIGQGGAGHPPLTLLVDGFGGEAGVGCGAGFDFATLAQGLGL